KYRDSEEVEHWKQFDPITRLEAFLRARGVLDDEAVATVADEAETLAASVRDAMNTEAEIDPTELFAYVYANPRPALREQQAQCEAELAGAHA
ncbi:pyruvate dehydrogenase (acetyl-transferring) E1 component subunit alpha, partial [Burkholderia multivorans]